MKPEVNYANWFCMRAEEQKTAVQAATGRGWDRRSNRGTAAASRAMSGGWCNRASANLAEDDGVLVGPLLALLREEGGHLPAMAVPVRSPAALLVHHVHHVLVGVLLLLHAPRRGADPHVDRGDRRTTRFFPLPSFCLGGREQSNRSGGGGRQRQQTRSSSTMAGSEPQSQG